MILVLIYQLEDLALQNMLNNATSILPNLYLDMPIVPEPVEEHQMDENESTLKMRELLKEHYGEDYHKELPSSNYQTIL